MFAVHKCFDLPHFCTISGYHPSKQSPMSHCLSTSTEVEQQACLYFTQDKLYNFTHTSFYHLSLTLKTFNIITAPCIAQYYISLLPGMINTEIQI